MLIFIVTFAVLYDFLQNVLLIAVFQLLVIKKLVVLMSENLLAGKCQTTVLQSKQLNVKQVRHKLPMLIQLLSYLGDSSYRTSSVLRDNSPVGQNPVIYFQFSH